MAKNKTHSIIKKLNKYLNDWLQQHDFDCTVRYASDFGYESINEIIEYSFLVTNQHDELFFDFCKQLQPDLILCDNFILSFFHELGHHITNDDFSEKEYEDYLQLTEDLNVKDKLTKEECLKYYSHPVEYEATDWGCQYIVDNADEISKFYATIQKFELEYLSALEEQIKRQKQGGLNEKQKS